MVVLFQIIAACVIFVSCGALAYGALRLSHPSARLYWADLILAALFVACYAALFLTVSIIWTSDLGRLGVGGLSFIAISYRLSHLDPRLWHSSQNRQRPALAGRAAAQPSAPHRRAGSLARLTVLRTLLSYTYPSLLIKTRRRPRSLCCQGTYKHRLCYEQQRFERDSEK